MKPLRLLYLTHVVTFTMLFQSGVFAVENLADNTIVLETNVESSSTSNPLPGLDGSHTHSIPGGNERGALEQGQPLPVLDIEVGGEIFLNDDDIIERPWSSDMFKGNGKVQLVQYVAANRGAVGQNKPFTQAIIEKQFPPEKLGSTVIVNMADTMSFAKGIVVSKVAKRKAERQYISFVMDNDGVGLQRWGMKNKSCAIIVLDASGNVLFAKDGPLSELEIAHTIALIEQQMG